jgi:hypothetical protein
VYNKAVPALGAILLLGSAAAWYWWPRLAPTPAPPPPVTAGPVLETAPAIANPMPAADANTASLPALAASDKPFAKELTGIPGAASVASYLRHENLIRHIVATVDNLPRHKLAVDLLPLHRTAGAFTASGTEDRATLDTRSTLRYAPLVAILGRLDMHAVNGLYQNYYPLFQRAYQDLGYPQGYFNDRLVAVIDNLLATPKLTGPVALVRPKVFWEYADPDLEARCAWAPTMPRLWSGNCASCARWSRPARMRALGQNPGRRRPRTIDGAPSPYCIACDSTLHGGSGRHFRAPLPLSRWPSRSAAGAATRWPRRPSRRIPRWWAIGSRSRPPARISTAN